MVEKYGADYQRIGMLQNAFDRELQNSLGGDQDLVDRALSLRTPQEVMNFRRLDAEGARDFAHQLAERAREETGNATEPTPISETPTSMERNELARQRAYELALQQMKAVQQEQPPEPTRSEKLDELADIPERRSFIRKLPEEYERAIGRETMVQALEEELGDHAVFVLENYVPEGIRRVIEQIAKTSTGQEQIKRLASQYTNLYREAMLARAIEREMEEEMKKINPAERAAMIRAGETPAPLFEGSRPDAYQDEYDTATAPRMEVPQDDATQKRIAAAQARIARISRRGPEQGNQE